MGINIYVGNLDYNVESHELESWFAEFGAVDSAKVIFDRVTNRSKGFGFVEMASKEEGQAAINALDGSDKGGRSIKVNEARPRVGR